VGASVITDVVMPQMGLEVTEGTVAVLHVAAGAEVAEGDVLLEVETDKALSEIVAPCDGVIGSIAVAEGDTVPVGALLLRIGDEKSGPDPDFSRPVAAPDEKNGSEPAFSPAAVAPDERTGPDPVFSPDRRRGAHTIKAAPVARRAAHHHGLELAAITGTGPRGRITLRDVEQAVAAGSGASDGAKPLSVTRRAIAERMTESQRIPQFALDREIDATWLLAEKARLTKEGPVKVGVNDLLVQALAEALGRHTTLASSYVEPSSLRTRERVDVGLAVATDRGLLVPVIRAAAARTLGELALDRARLVTAARAGRLTRDEMTGAAITLSSLAAFGVDRFTAMLNPGESAILAVGRTVDKVVPKGRGIAVIPAITLTLTLDHRVVDGAVGAAALAELADLLEGEMTWRT
jgi:pyruvate dehydrogenase E2 component (dihydrolipoamide acetyltransferase)